MDADAEMKAVAVKCNPVIGYWDPLDVAQLVTVAKNRDEAIGYLRHSEIKHGRVAMFAFVGFIAGSNGLCFPWDLTLSGVKFADIAAAGGPAEQWDALPTNSKLQIFALIAFLEIVSESSSILAKNGEKHYMRGGTPGYFPPLKGEFPHDVPFNYFDPFGFSKNRSDEDKAKGRITEINNGRLAMIGIMGFVSEAKVPGSVPWLSGLIKPYSGEVMAPFSASDASLPFVTKMLEVSEGLFPAGQFAPQ